MFKFITPAYWHHKVSGTLLTDMVRVMQALPEIVKDQMLGDDIPPASMLGTAASQGAQALSAAADFTVAATGSLLNLAWNGLVTHGPPLAKGLWSGVTTYGPPLAQGAWDGLKTYGPPLAQGAWNGLKTYGPPTAEALGKSAAWAGAHAWEAAKWGGSAVLAAAEQHHVKEQVLAAGREVLGSVMESVVRLTHAAGEQLVGNEAKDAQIKALAQAQFPMTSSVAGDAHGQGMLDGQDALGKALPSAMPRLDLAEDMVLSTASCEPAALDDNAQILPGGFDSKADLHGMDLVALVQSGDEMALSQAWHKVHDADEAFSQEELQDFQFLSSSLSSCPFAEVLVY